MAPVEDSPAAVLILSVEIPVLQLNNIIRLNLKPQVPAQQEMLLDRVAGCMVEICGDLTDHLQAIEWDGNEEKLERFRAKAMQALDDLAQKQKACEDGLRRAEVAKTQLNDMRESYYKELTQLRQQLHLKREAEKAGQTYEPAEYSMFDPTRYAWDDATKALMQRVAAEWQRHFDEYKSMLGGQAGELTSQLQTAKMMLDRKDQLLQALMKRHGYSGELALEKSLAADDRPAGPPTLRFAKTKSVSEDQIESHVSLASRKSNKSGRMLPMSFREAAYRVKASLVNSACRALTPSHRRGSSRKASRTISFGRSLRMSKTKSNVSDMSAAVGAGTEAMNTCESSAQTITRGADIDEALAIVFSKRCDEQWQECPGVTQAPGYGPDAAGDDCFKPLPTGEEVRRRTIRRPSTRTPSGGFAVAAWNFVDASSQTENAQERAFQEIGVQCIQSDADDILQEAEQEFGQDFFASNESVSSVRWTSLGSPKDDKAASKTLVTSIGGVTDILNKHGVPTASVSSAESLPEDFKLRRKGTTPLARPRRASAPQRIAFASSPGNMSDDPACTFVSITATCTITPGPARAQRRTSAVTPQVAAELAGACGRPASAMKATGSLR